MCKAKWILINSKVMQSSREEKINTIKTNVQRKKETWKQILLNGMKDHSEGGMWNRKSENKRG